MELPITFGPVPTVSRPAIKELSGPAISNKGAQEKAELLADRAYFEAPQLGAASPLGLRPFRGDPRRPGFEFPPSVLTESQPRICRLKALHPRALRAVDAHLSCESPASRGDTNSCPSGIEL